MSKAQEEFAQAAAKLIQQAVTMGYTVTLGEAWRTPQQAQWNAQHGTGIAHSLHTDRVAIDLDFFKDGVWVTDGSKLEDIGAWWEAQGVNYAWGGRFKHLPDGNHFSISPDGVIK